MEKSNQELYQERMQRVKDVIALKAPDRVPIVSPIQAFTYWYAGVSLKEAMYDYATARKAARKFCLDFQPDLDFGPVMMYPAKAMDLLGLQWFRWPGHGISENTMYQFIEGEYMKEDEYDEFIFDPGHFMTTKWMPRSFGNLKGLEKFPTLRCDKTVPPRCAMPWVSEVKTENPLMIAASARRRVTKRTPWPPTPLITICCFMDPLILPISLNFRYMETDRMLKR